jgi:hypothetical protein
VAHHLAEHRDVILRFVRVAGARKTQLAQLVPQCNKMRSRPSR